MPAGRPTSLTPELAKRILASIRAGNYKSTACQAAGIHRDTLNDWEHRGARGEEPYAEFSDALQKAEATAERKLLRQIRLGVDGWQSKAWIMERRWPAKWGGRVRTVVNDEVATLLAKVQHEPELHARLRDVLGEGDPQGSSPRAAH
jgi:hypothetical protein